MNDIKAELAAAEAALKQLDEAAAKRSEVVRLRELKDQIRQRQEEAQEAALEERLIEEHGPRGEGFEIRRYGEHLVAVHKPNKPSHEAYMRKMLALKEGQSPPLHEVRNYVVRSLIQPAPDDFGAVEADFPHAPIELAGVLMDMAKGAANARRGK